MRIVKPTIEIIEQAPGLDGIYKQIELAGKECYASSHTIGENTAKGFVERMINSGHGAILEHGTVYLQMPYSQEAWIMFSENKYSVLRHDEYVETLYVTTNYRVIIENGIEHMLQYLVEPTPMHEKRVTARFNCQIAISREFNRHRVNSMAEQSTRYCNYSKSRFGNEISINLPSRVSDGGMPVVDDVKSFKEWVSHIAENGDDSMRAIDWWLFANTACEYSYLKLIENGWLPQDARTILPLDTNTVLVHTASTSDWEHFFWLRAIERPGNKPHPDAMAIASELRKLFIKKGYIHGSDK